MQSLIRKTGEAHPPLAVGTSDAKDWEMVSLFLALLAASAAPAPISTTMDAIRADPARFDGQWVRLRGQIDQCTHFDCSICPEEATPSDPMAERCLRLSWDRQVGDPQERGADFDPIYRYATVDLVARFDSACLKGMCTDRASVLRDSRVAAVMKRRTSAEGLNSRRQVNRLLEAPAAAAAPLIALIRGKQETGPFGPVYRVFTGPDDPNIERSAIVCRSRGERGARGAWPADQGSALFARSTEDSFKCFFAEKSDGQWFIRPD